MRGGVVFRKFVWLFVIFPAGAVLVAFALANRHLVRLNLDPFSSEDPFLALDAPFFLFLLAALITGLLLGGFVTWFGQGKWRKEARNRAKETWALRAETEALNTQLRARSEPRLDRAEAAE
jgi:uncharacterized integral membrane protein